MNDRLRESLSALMDDEANELEIERILSGVTGDRDLRQTWYRYNATRAVVAGHQLAQCDIDISGRVREALAGQSLPGTESSTIGLKAKFLRPVASFAVAASVAATVIIGGQQLAGLDAGTSQAGNQTVASSVSAVGMMHSLGAVPVRASYGTQAVPVLQPASRTAYRELARQRMEKYVQEHAEHAALNSPHGLIPFARVIEIRE